MTGKSGYGPGRGAGRIAARRGGLTGAAILQSVIGLAIAMTALLGGCDGEESAGLVVTVDQALAGEGGRLIGVEGQIVATETDVLLASALLESYPPQAGGAVLPVRGLELAALVGLRSTSAQPELAQVTWSEHPVVLEGVVKGGILEVKGLPRVVEAATTEAKVRFSPSREPLMAGGMVWWAFDVTNLTTRALNLGFADGQTGEVVLTQGGEEKYRWSAGKAFVQAIGVDTIEPGRTVSYVFNDVLHVEPGEYRLTAKVTASVEGIAAELPEVVTTVTVR